MAIHPVLIAGEWRAAPSPRTFSAENPALGEKLPGEYPISGWADVDAALTAATAAAAVLRALRGVEVVARGPATSRSPSTAIIETLDRRP